MSGAGAPKNPPGGQAFLERHAPIVLFAFTVLLCFGADVLGATVIHAIRRRPPDRAPDAEAEKTYRVQSPYYHHDLATRATAMARWGPRTYAIKTNSLGFKDSSNREVPLASPSRRILFIGDSFTEGIGVEYPKTFVGLIGAQLAPKGVEVLNAAVASYCPAIYFAKIRHLIETVGLRVDEVVVYLDISDPDDEARYYRVAEDGQILDTGRPKGLQYEMADYLPQSPIMRFIQDHTLLTRSIVCSIRDHRVELVPHDLLKNQVNLVRGAWTFDKKALDLYGRVGLERMTASMDRLAALLRARHIPLTVAVYPWPSQVMFDSVESLPVKHWRAWAVRNGTGFLSHFPDFIGVGDRRSVILRYYIPGDTHVNEEGHARIAKRFLEYYNTRSGPPRQAGRVSQRRPTTESGAASRPSTAPPVREPAEARR